MYKKYITMPLSNNGWIVITGLNIIERYSSDDGRVYDTEICIICKPFDVAERYSRFIINKDIFEIPRHLEDRFEIKPGILTSKVFCDIWNEIYINNHFPSSLQSVEYLNKLEQKYEII